MEQRSCLFLASTQSTASSLVNRLDLVISIEIFYLSASWDKKTFVIVRFVLISSSVKNCIKVLLSADIYIAIHRYVLSDVSIELWSLNFRFLSKHHASHTPLCHISLAWAHQNLGVQLHTRFRCPCRNIRWWWFPMVSNHCIKSCYLSDQQFFSSINPKYNNLFCQIYVDVHKLFWNSNLQVWNFRTICVNLCKPDKISRYRTLFPYKSDPMPSFFT